MKKRFVEDKKIWDDAIEVAEKEKAAFDDKIKTFRIESEKLFKSIFPKQQIMASKEIQFKTRTLPLFGE